MLHNQFVKTDPGFLCSWAEVFDAQEIVFVQFEFAFAMTGAFWRMRFNKGAESNFLLDNVSVKRLSAYTAIPYRSFFKKEDIIATCSLVTFTVGIFGALTPAACSSNGFSLERRCASTRRHLSSVSGETTLLPPPTAFSSSVSETAGLLNLITPYTVIISLSNGTKRYC